jgi:hypothetical protein
LGRKDACGRRRGKEWCGNNLRMIGGWQITSKGRFRLSNVAVVQTIFITSPSKIVIQIILSNTGKVGRAEAIIPEVADPETKKPPTLASEPRQEGGEGDGALEDCAAGCMAGPEWIMSKLRSNSLSKDQRVGT